MFCMTLDLPPVHAKYERVAVGGDEGESTHRVAAHASVGPKVDGVPVLMNRRGAGTGLGASSLAPSSTCEQKGMRPVGLSISEATPAVAKDNPHEMSALRISPSPEKSDQSADMVPSRPGPPGSRR